MLPPRIDVCEQLVKINFVLEIEITTKLNSVRMQCVQKLLAMIVFIIIAAALNIVYGIL